MEKKILLIGIDPLSISLCLQRLQKKKVKIVASQESLEKRVTGDEIP
jgi:hypothetical protein